MSNTIPYVLPGLRWPARTRAMAVVSDYCLSIFLAMSLMSMKLWTLAELGGPLLGVLALQVLGTTVFILFIVFRFMGRDYTAAVLSAGFAGFSLGATPTAIANMSSVTKRYGPAPLAFIVLPLSRHSSSTSPMPSSSSTSCLCRDGRWHFPEKPCLKLVETRVQDDFGRKLAGCDWFQNKIFE